MQPNIAMIFAGYMAWILLWKCCKFGEKIYYSSRDIEFFLGDYFFLARPVYSSRPTLDPYPLQYESVKNYSICILVANYHLS